MNKNELGYFWRISFSKLSVTDFMTLTPSISLLWYRIVFGQKFLVLPLMHRSARYFITSNPFFGCDRWKSKLIVSMEESSIPPTSSISFSTSSILWRWIHPSGAFLWSSSQILTIFVIQAIFYILQYKSKRVEEREKNNKSTWQVAFSIRAIKIYFRYLWMLRIAHDWQAVVEYL